MQDAVCREFALAQQLFLLQTRDTPGDKAALKAALLADVFSNGASRLVALACCTAAAERVSPSRRRRSCAAVPALLRAPGMERRRGQAGRHAGAQRSNPDGAGQPVRPRRASPLLLSLTAPTAVRRHSVADAVANLGETEVREAQLAKATFFVKIGDKVCAAALARDRTRVDSPASCRAQAASEAAFAETEKKVRREAATAPFARALISRAAGRTAADGCARPEDGPGVQPHARALLVWRLSGHQG
jgi:hypothetical protein